VTEDSLAFVTCVKEDFKGTGKKKKKEKKERMIARRRERKKK
jgi:hypothetical protein